MLNEDQIAQLRTLYGSDPTSQVILDHFAERERNRGEVTVERLMALENARGAKLSRGVVIKFMRELETLELGKFIEGRWNNKSRFKWADGIGVVVVGRVASGESSVEVEEFLTDEEIDDEVGPEASDHLAPITQVAPPSGGVIEHSYRLRRDFIVKLLLPETMTDAEANRLAEFVKTLPFD